jgi:O-methyltransferase
MILIIRPTDAYMRRKRHDFIFKNQLDYIRLSSLEFVAEEIKQRDIAGNIAELGVYRGEFAKIMNLLFFDKKLYLFDTFEGFNKKDMQIEEDNNFSDIRDNFSQTNIDIVMGKMEYPENCIVKKGYFPDTIIDVNDNFCFVSIDCDLYLPVYEGLRYFYPRLNRGGYIFVHDYNNDKKYKGAKKAVTQFAMEQDLFFFPLSDRFGTAVFIKP